MLNIIFYFAVRCRTFTKNVCKGRDIEKLKLNMIFMRCYYRPAIIIIIIIIIIITTTIFDI
jgi:hypothetical protein